MKKVTLASMITAGGRRFMADDGMCYDAQPKDYYYFRVGDVVTVDVKTMRIMFLSNY